MKSENLFGLVAIIVALHVVLLSMLFGPRHVGYSGARERGIA